jgi:hypothetical protein
MLPLHLTDNIICVRLKILFFFFFRLSHNTLGFVLVGIINIVILSHPYEINVTKVTLFYKLKAQPSAAFYMPQ